MSTQLSVSVLWEEVPAVEIAVGKRIADANARWNITPCGRVVVQFDGEPVAYRMDPRRAVRALCQARTAEHVQPPDPPARRPGPGPALRAVVLIVLCGLLAGCLSASWIFGVFAAKETAETSDGGAVSLDLGFCGQGRVYSDNEKRCVVPE